MAQRPWTPERRHRHMDLDVPLPPHRQPTPLEPLSIGAQHPLVCEAATIDWNGTPPCPAAAVDWSCISSPMFDMLPGSINLQSIKLSKYQAIWKLNRRSIVWSLDAVEAISKP
jgi:hypothetical protein